MVPLNQLTRETILSKEILTEVFDQEDELYKAELLASLGLRAAELKVKTEFKDLVAAYKRVERDMKKQTVSNDISLLDNWTNFSGPYDNMKCKTWIASDDGIYQYNPNPMAPDLLACYHPILPVERFKNLETGEEQIKIAFKRSGRWEEIIVPKTLITSASKIVALSSRGVAVTSENAKSLVRYLSDVENLNDNEIKVQHSTSKLGWVKGDFIPYDTNIVFDGDGRFRDLFDSVQERGSETIWLKHMTELRKTGRAEVKFMLAASFASVLVGLLGGLPFFVDLWGETEGGKTVSLMVATSVWADPGESRYIGDFKTTDVALEAKVDMLNNLPMILDDTSKTSSRIRDNFEGVVYDLCSGKGKSRSNKELGINRENRWRNCIIVNGERPLNSYVNQGGAINRILEVECGEKIYKDPQETVEIVKKNYGFAGKRFVEIVKEMDIEEIKKIQKEFQKQLFDSDKMQKQAMSLSIILTADKIATEQIFKDGQYISIEEGKQVLIDRSALSDNERCYQFILDKVAMNGQRFDIATNCEKWGVFENEYIVFYNQAFTDLCKSGGFSRKSFLSWADKEGLIKTNKGEVTKNKRIGDKIHRCVYLKQETENNLKTDSDGFMTLENSEQEMLPFS